MVSVIICRWIDNHNTLMRHVIKIDHIKYKTIEMIYLHFAFYDFTFNTGDLGLCRNMDIG